ncbi:hypothetical protein AA21952_1273 [Acetobacter oeni LMG 21952]|nr:hypothetical protein AA21952_1273 [Acetobacter oeni LMG 21952]
MLAVLGLPSVVVETTLPEASVTVIVMVPLLLIVCVVVSVEEAEELLEEEDELADDESNRLDTDDVPERPEMEDDMGLLLLLEHPYFLILAVEKTLRVA